MMKTAMEHRVVEHQRGAFQPCLRRTITLMSAEQHLLP